MDFKHTPMFSLKGQFVGWENREVFGIQSLKDG